MIAKPSITFDRDRTDYVLRTEQALPGTPDEVFPFFADAHNLERITPPRLRFRILTPGPIEIREGRLIDYCISLRGLPMRWRTRITAWDPPHRFQDTQVRGPYALWVHTHSFHPSGDRTIMTDVVRYRPPLGPLGRLANRTLIERELLGIFAFRRAAIERIVDSAPSILTGTPSLDEVDRNLPPPTAGRLSMPDSLPDPAGAPHPLPNASRTE